MEKQTIGTVVAVWKQWWLKINTKPARSHMMDGAIFPHIIKIQYTVDGKEYAKFKWINAGQPAPKAGSSIHISYRSDKPSKSRLL